MRVLRFLIFLSLVAIFNLLRHGFFSTNKISIAVCLCIEFHFCFKLFHSITLSQVPLTWTGAEYTWLVIDLVHLWSHHWMQIFDVSMRRWPYGLLEIQWCINNMAPYCQQFPWTHLESIVFQNDTHSPKQLNNDVKFSVAMECVAYAKLLSTSSLIHHDIFIKHIKYMRRTCRIHSRTTNFVVWAA